MFKRIIFHFSRKIKKRLFKVTSVLLAVVLLFSSIPLQNFVKGRDFSAKVKNTDYSKVSVKTELKDERTETTKTFLKEDGTFELDLYNEPVHYNVNGKWEDINNSLITVDSDSGYENTSNIYKVKLPKTIDNNQLFKLKTADYEIEWNFLDISKSTVEKTVNTESSDIRDLAN